MEFRIRELKEPDKTIIPIKYLDTREPEILTDEYVSELNREIAYRIKDGEARNMVPLEEVSMYQVKGNLETKGNTRSLTR